MEKTHFNYKKLALRKSYYNFLDFFSKNKKEKIFLKHLDLESTYMNDQLKNFLYFLSDIYDFSRLNSIFLTFYRFSEIDYTFFPKMNKLKVVDINFYGLTERITFKKVFENLNLFDTVISITIHLAEITPDDIHLLESYKNLLSLSIALDTVDYKIVQNISRKNFKNTEFVLMKPIRSERSNEVNAYLDSEFMYNFP
ncbi:hypothetical protein LUQ84_003070 [Hamiltosporidium tvaerminnensis]|nr:hypothetical protein LUQ84_003070 [Hamiltosporidium tvaerminnensis]